MKIIKTLKSNNAHYLVNMCGDYNDGDYNYSSQKFTEKEFEQAKNVLFNMQKLIGKSYYDDDDNEDFVSKVSEIFNKYKYEVDYPYGDTASDCPIHTLESIDIEYIDNDGKTYDVELVED